MQRHPGYNPNMPGAPMQNNFNPGMPGMPGMPGTPGMPGMPQHQMYGGPQPGFGPGPHPGQFNGPPPQQMQQQAQGCFMPAATIRKMSNTTPPAQFFNPPN